MREKVEKEPLGWSCAKCGAEVEAYPCRDCGYKPPVAKQGTLQLAASHVVAHGNRPAQAARPREKPKEEDWDDPAFRRSVFASWGQYQLQGWLSKKLRQTRSAEVTLKRLVWMSGGALSTQEADAKFGAMLRSQEKFLRGNA